jgi:hypothetical protein
MLQQDLRYECTVKLRAKAYECTVKLYTYGKITSIQ